MATLINPIIQASVNASISSSNTGYQTPIVLSTIAPYSITVGSAASQADGEYVADRSVTSGTPDVINLTTLTFLDGTAITAARVVAIIIVSRSTTSGQTLTHGGGTNPLYATNTQPIGPSGISLWYSPIDGGTTIVSGTNSNLQVTASTGTVSYSIRILTRSA